MTLSVTALQVTVYKWVNEAFNSVLEEPLHPRERALRVLEEAIELAQACGVLSKQACTLVNHVYSKPPDSPVKELAQTGVCLLAAASSLHVHLDNAMETEMTQVLSRPLEYYANRMRRKVELGLAYEIAVKDGQSSQNEVK